MSEIVAELLFRPPTSELRYLPEGPQMVDPQTLSWVAIQHGADQKVGSLNQLDLESGQNRTIPLEGRPGFAFVTDRPDTFVVGLERRLVVLDAAQQTTTPLTEAIVDDDVEGTIINDGEPLAEGILFGTKELGFSEPKAGLYLYRKRDDSLHRLRDDQVCSNGKVLFAVEPGIYRVFDIDSPTKKISEYRLDVERAELTEVRTAVDLSGGDVIPDGMVASPDGRGLIVAIYNPSDTPFGEARMYDIASGQLQLTWRVPESPQVTCPQLIERDGAVHLVLTTAVEDMDPERQARHPNAGSLFIAETPFRGPIDPPRFRFA